MKNKFLLTTISTILIFTGCDKISTSTSQTTATPVKTTAAAIQDTSNNSDNTNVSDNKLTIYDGTIAPLPNELGNFCTKADLAEEHKGLEDSSLYFSTTLEYGKNNIGENLYFKDKDIVKKINEEYPDLTVNNTPNELNEKLEAEMYSLIYEGPCSNLNLTPDDKTLYFTNKDKIVHTCDASSKKVSLYEPLSKYKVDHMQTINNDKIIFQSEGRVYIYIMAEDKVYYTNNLTDVEFFLTTSKGLLYVKRDATSSYIYINDDLRYTIDGSPKIQLMNDKSKNYYVYIYQNDISKYIKLDNFFNTSEEIRLIDENDITFY